MNPGSDIRWGQSIDLGGGVVTRGSVGAPSRQILRALDGIDFAGKKVLEVGCWDGLWSFEAEKRGAGEVWATDCVSQRWGGTAGFRFAHEALRSRVHYMSDLSVFDLPERFEHRDFDIVIYCGVYYHLKDPVLAFARIRRVMREGGIVVVEGEAFHDDDTWARFHYRDVYGNDRSNWWVPTTGCLKQWVECSFFEVTAQDPAPIGDREVPRVLRAWRALRGKRSREAPCRSVVVARAVRRSDPNYRYPDVELAEADLTDHSA